MTGSNKKQKGFSIVELLITGFVFSVVFGVATSTFVNAIRIQKYNMVQHQLLDQTSYAIEYMGRALRMVKTDDGTCGVGNGRNYKITDNGNRIVFKNYNDECVEFFWSNAAQELTVTISGPPIGTNYRLFKVPLNSDNYRITSARFYIRGENEGDNFQPSATVFMKLLRYGSLGPWTISNPRINIQTTVSQRELDS